MDKKKKKKSIPWKTIEVTWNNYLLKKFWDGMALVVQWLRISLPVQGMRVRSLVWELRPHMLQSSPCVTPTARQKPECCN